ncbi:hypothetical protein JZ751_022571 [Albula glossodonta]|uniref:Uncharacterized protein n=1 Tax=Albula glossodonta TaxID=121402 RepID=A0A8T2PFN6_9TELE|nr:hypothetical protein JZ751_022571 [Albula glossodonta]
MRRMVRGREGIRNITMDSSQMGMPMSDPNAWATAMNNLGMAPMGMSGQLAALCCLAVTNMLDGSLHSVINHTGTQLFPPGSQTKLSANLITTFTGLHQHFRSEDGLPPAFCAETPSSSKH